MDGTVIETVICRKKFGKKGKERKAEVEKKSNLGRFFLDDLENSRMGGKKGTEGRIRANLFGGATIATFATRLKSFLRPHSQY